MSAGASDLHDARERLPLVGLEERDVPHVVAAADLARERILRAREALAAVTRAHAATGVAALALGSLGRHEAVEGSDLDLAWLFDASEVGADDAAAQRTPAIRALRDAGFDVSEKTFRAPVAIGSLVENVGGENDTNEHLTYRALLLTESAWLLGPERADEMRSRLFGVYRDGITRGRFMATLLNDLLRYWRTVCVDYRYKIEEGDKGWALRYMKLRHTRRTWHLGNLVLHCAARAVAAGEGHDDFLAARIRLPPLVKIADALDALGDGRVAADLWRAQDAFLAVVASPEARARLEALRPGEQDGCAELGALKDNAAALDAAAERIVELLLEREPSRGHLIRFGLL